MEMEEFKRLQLEGLPWLEPQEYVPQMETTYGSGKENPRLRRVLVLQMKARIGTVRWRKGSCDYLCGNHLGHHDSEGRKGTERDPHDPFSLMNKFCSDMND